MNLSTLLFLNLQQIEAVESSNIVLLSSTDIPWQHGVCYNKTNSTLQQMINCL